MRAEAALRKSWWAVALVVAVTRIPGFAFGILNIDESDFVLFGRRIVEGALPYVQIVDHKPPLTYLAFALGGLFGPASLVPMRVLSFFWILATLALVARAAREWTGDELAGIAAAWLALLANFCELPLIYLPMSFCSGLWVPFMFLPKVVKQIALVLPPYHLSQLALGVVGAGTHESVPTHWEVLLAFTMICLGIARIGFQRDQEKMYG